MQARTDGCPQKRRLTHCLDLVVPARFRTYWNVWNQCVELDVLDGFALRGSILSTRRSSTTRTGTSVTRTDLDILGSRLQPLRACLPQRLKSHSLCRQNRHE